MNHLMTRLAIAVALSLAGAAARAADAPLDFRADLITVRHGFDLKTCWVHARAGIIPAGAAGNPSAGPLAVMTMQKLLLTGSDVFYGLNSMVSTDLGRTWTDPQPQAAMARRDEGDGVEAVVANFTPKWHAATGRLLGTGNLLRYKGDKLLPGRRAEVSWSVYDPAARTWSAPGVLALPDEAKFQMATAGCTQRVDLPGGDTLLPIYFRASDATRSSATVVRCRFDGHALKYLEHGTELTEPEARGYGEPSLAQFRGRFYLTLRHDKFGAVAASADGLHFDAPRKWTFDDGSDLGNYNTQQHWVTHSDGLFLVYTRRGANNDRVFRHRAPLFIARVDPEKLCVIRATERAIVPERGARLGNFGVTDVGPGETWVTVAEWMQPRGVEKYGGDNAVYVARLIWSKPNGQMEAGR